jgi:hypothetical protein
MRNEAAGFGVIVFKLHQVRSCDHKLGRQVAAKKTSGLGREALQEHTEYPRIACSIDNHPKIASEALRPQMPLEYA